MKIFIEEFVSIILHTTEKLLELSEEQSAIPVAPGKWSPKQIIGHLIDSASNNHQRFVRIQFPDDKFFPRYHQDDWVTVQHYQGEPWELLVKLWKYYNLHLAHIIVRMPEAVIQERITKYTSEQISWVPAEQRDKFNMEYLIRDYVEHMKHHLNQLFGD